MATIEVHGHLKGEATTEARAGLRMSASAQCFGRAAGGIGQRLPVPQPPRAPEPQTKGK